MEKQIACVVVEVVTYAETVAADAVAMDAVVDRLADMQEAWTAFFDLDLACTRSASADVEPVVRDTGIVDAAAVVDLDGASPYLAGAHVGCRVRVRAYTHSHWEQAVHGFVDQGSSLVAECCSHFLRMALSPFEVVGYADAGGDTALRHYSWAEMRMDHVSCVRTQVGLEDAVPGVGRLPSFPQSLPHPHPHRLHHPGPSFQQSRQDLCVRVRRHTMVYQYQTNQKGDVYARIDVFLLSLVYLPKSTRIVSCCGQR